MTEHGLRLPEDRFWPTREQHEAHLMDAAETKRRVHQTETLLGIVALFTVANLVLDVIAIVGARWM